LRKIAVMEEKKIQKVLTNFEQKYRAWLKSQESQESAYDYEKSFTDLIREISKDMLFTTTASELKSRNSKKKFKLQLDIWR
jgi:hemerythrin-like domain-containing protein